MSVAYKYPITFTDNLSGKTFYSPQTTGTYYLRRAPYSTNTYTGSHIGDGVWDFGTIEDGYYQLWNATTQIAKYGTQYLGDKDPSFDSMSVTGDVSVSGQVNFYNSFNMNSADVAHVDNLQVNSFSENVAGAGVRFDHRIQMSDALRTASNFASLTSNNTFGNSLNRFTINPEYIGSSAPSASGLITKYHADATYGRLSNGNNWTAVNNYSQYPVFNGSGSVSLPKQFTTKEYVDNAVLTANFSSITSAFVNQVSTNVVRLLANGTNSTSQNVATSWALAMKRAKDSITASSYSATKEMIIQIEGVGESSTSLPMLNTEIGTYFYPNVHARGISQSVKLQIEDDAYNSGTDASKCLMENVTIYRDDLGTGTPSFSNITFKDCYFDMNVAGFNLTNCMFKGTNILKMYSSTLTLNSCSGTTYYTTVVPTETGTTPPFLLSSYL